MLLLILFVNNLFEAVPSLLDNFKKEQLGVTPLGVLFNFPVNSCGYPYGPFYGI